MIFSHVEYANHEKVLFVSDRASGLRAIIAVHSTALGPALGGCRCWRYASEEAALNDVLRLSTGMTYKSSIAGVDLGGGKSVILLGPGQSKTPELMRAMARAIDSLGGIYITGEDIGTGLEDMAEMRRLTPHVLGAPAELGGSGDPSPMTALGVFVGIEASVRHRLHRDLSGCRVLVQGLGNVGGKLCRLLHGAGARLYVSDVRAERLDRAVSEFGAVPIPPEEIIDVEADVFAPCAFGAVVSADVIGRMKFPVIAGGANNQLKQDADGELLADNGILYAPDFVINGGGLIALAHERTGYDAHAVERQVRGIADTLHSIFERADRDGMSTNRVAKSIAEARVQAAQRRH